MKNRDPGFPLLSGLGGFFSVSKSLSVPLVCVLTEHRISQKVATKKSRSDFTSKRLFVLFIFLA